MDGTGEDDPREFARENEAAEMAHNAFFNALFNLSAPGAPGSPSGRSGASNSPTPGTPTRTSRAPRSGLRVEVVSSGANGSPHRRTITFGAAPRDRDRTETAGPGIGANYQTDLPEFVLSFTLPPRSNSSFYTVLCNNVGVLYLLVPLKTRSRRRSDLDVLESSIFIQEALSPQMTRVQC